MILKQEQKIAEHGARMDVIQFAWFPTQLKRNTSDKAGAVIWLEKYVESFVAKRILKSGPHDEWEWEFSHSERLTKSVLAQFEDAN